MRPQRERRPTTRVDRSLDDAFADTYFLPDVAPLQVPMPLNFGDLETNLVAGLRVDSFAAVARHGPFASLEDELRAIYADQKAFLEDPGRYRLVRRGRVSEELVDGKVIATIDLKFRHLPLTVYTGDSYQRALFEVFDPGQLVQVVADGSLAGRLRVEMELPESGAPLLYWDASREGRVRLLHFIGVGRGVLTGPNAERLGHARVAVDCCSTERRETVRVVPLDDASSRESPPGRHRSGRRRTCRGSSPG